jgi:hypothetical protein
MAEIPIDFITLLQDIRGKNFDTTTGLPTDGKWLDVKNSHTAVGISATQVATDLAATIVAKNSASASASLATSEATEAINASDAAQKASSLASTSQTSANTSAVNALASANASAVSATLATTKASDSASSASLSSGSAAAASTSAINSAASASAAATSASSIVGATTTATTAKDAAQSSAVASAASAGLASTSETNAGNSAIAAAASVTTATTRVSEATTQKNQAADWAIGAENLAITDGVHSGYSAFHWSAKAAAAVATLGGVTKFTQMLDAPQTLVGSANKYLRVNSSATLLEFDSLDKTDVGLNLVDNIADADKQVSSATQTALSGKSNQADLTAGLLRVTTLEGNTSGLSVQAVAGANPIRLLADKEIYTSTTQVLATLQDAALTTFSLLKSALEAETIGTY